MSSRFQTGTQASGALISAQRLCLTPDPHLPHSPTGAQEAPGVTVSTSELRPLMFQAACPSFSSHLHRGHFPAVPVPFRSSHHRPNPAHPSGAPATCLQSCGGFLIPLRHHPNQEPRHVDPEYAWAPRPSHEIHRPLSSWLPPLPAACTAPRGPLHHPNLCTCSQCGRHGGLLAQSPGPPFHSRLRAEPRTPPSLQADSRDQYPPLRTTPSLQAESRAQYPPLRTTPLLQAESRARDPSFTPG